MLRQDKGKVSFLAEKMLAWTRISIYLCFTICRSLAPPTITAIPHCATALSLLMVLRHHHHCHHRHNTILIITIIASIANTYASLVI